VVAAWRTVEVDLPTAVLLLFEALLFLEFTLALLVVALLAATVVPFCALIVRPMLLRVLLVFWPDLPATDADFWTVAPLLLPIPMLWPLTLLRTRLTVTERLVVPITLPMLELFGVLMRAVELEAEGPAVVERSSTVRCTFEDLPTDLLLPELTRELRLEDRLGVDVLARALLLGLLERVTLDRLLLALLLLETDELRPVEREEDGLEELEDRLVELRELLLRELLLREPLLELLLRELLLREPLLLEVPLDRELFAKRGSAARIRAITAAIREITTCFWHFSVNMILLLSFTFVILHINAPSELLPLIGAAMTSGNTVFGL